LLIKYTKSILWRVAERLSYVEDAWCLKVKVCYIETLDASFAVGLFTTIMQFNFVLSEVLAAPLYVK